MEDSGEEIFAEGLRWRHRTDLSNVPLPNNALQVILSSAIFASQISIDLCVPLNHVNTDFSRNATYQFAHIRQPLIGKQSCTVLKIKNRAEITCCLCNQSDLEPIKVFTALNRKENYSIKCRKWVQRNRQK